VEIIKIFSERAKMNSKIIDEEYFLEMRECLIWALNNLNEITSQPVDNKNDPFESRKKEYSSTYQNCLHLISSRITLLKIFSIEKFTSDSQITGGVFRIFRKIVQLLTNDSTTMIDKTVVTVVDPKSFSIDFRVIFIINLF
jgi:hypothetical protein